MKDAEISEVQIRKWTLYFSRRGRHSTHKEYSDSIEAIAEITNLEGFFKLYLSMKVPSDCPDDSKIMFFLKGCTPMWENWPESGCLLINFKSKSKEQMHLLDQLWEYLLLVLVGNNLHDDVIGLVLNKREKLALLEIWLRTDSKALEIGKRIQAMIQKDLVQMSEGMCGMLKIRFKRHRDSMSTQSTIKGAHNLGSVHLSKFQSKSL